MKNKIFGVSFHIGTGTELALKEMCSNYANLNEELHKLSEDEILMAIIIEKQTKMRSNIINRLYSRYSALRKHRERVELYRVE